MARARKSGRFQKTKRRTSRKKSFNVGKAAETALVANAAINGLFAVNLPTFVTGKNILGGFGGDNYPDSNNSWEITLPELGNILMGGTGGVNKSFVGGFPAAIRKNIRDNGFSSIVQMLLIPAAFSVGRKVLAKPLINPTNRMLKQVGLKEVKL
mgnify:CR=1 FL=1